MASKTTAIGRSGGAEVDRCGRADPAGLTNTHVREVDCIRMDDWFDNLSCLSCRCASYERPDAPKTGGLPWGDFGVEDKRSAKTAVKFIEDWLHKREMGDVEGAAADCTAGVVIESPGSQSIVGLETVRDKIFSKTAPKPSSILHSVQPKPGEKDVYWRMATFALANGKQTRVRREWHLVYDTSDNIKISKIVLKKANEDALPPSVGLPVPDVTFAVHELEMEADLLDKFQTSPSKYAWVTIDPLGMAAALNLQLSSKRLAVAGVYPSLGIEP